MFFRICLSTVFIIFLESSLHAQKYIGLNVDNDLYFGIDRYYSSGIFLQWGKLKATEKDSLSRTVYKSKHWTIGQEINTPSLRLTEELAKMDYPYNGWLYLRFTSEQFFSPDQGYGWGVQIGTTGAEASLAKFFQNTYHIHILNLDPLTWTWSIPQAFHLNLNASYLWGTSLGNKFKWVNRNDIQGGTFRTSLKTRFGLQYGSISGLPFFGNRLEEWQEGISIFLGIEVEYNIHDYSLSSSWFNDNGPFELVANDFRNKFQIGIVYNRKPWSVHAMLNNSSRLITTQRYSRHPFINIALNFIF